MANQSVNLTDESVSGLDIDLNQYDVIRKEYFGGTNEPQFTFNKGRVYINGCGLRMMNCCNYVQLLFDKEKKTLVVKESDGKNKDSIRWCTTGKKKKPRHMRCIPLYYLVYEMMGWNVQARYKITGFKKTNHEGSILYFDLKDAVCYLSTGEYDSLGRPIVVERFPKEWEGGFGISLMEYEERECISLYEDAMSFQIELPVNDEKREEVMNATTEESVTEDK